MKTEKSQFDELIEFIKKLPINILSAIIILLCQRIHTPIKQFFCHHEIITEDGYYRPYGSGYAETRYICRKCKFVKDYNCIHC